MVDLQPALSHTFRTPDTAAPHLESTDRARACTRGRSPWSASHRTAACSDRIWTGGNLTMGLDWQLVRPLTCLAVTISEFLKLLLSYDARWHRPLTFLLTQSCIAMTAKVVELHCATCCFRIQLNLLFLYCGRGRTAAQHIFIKRMDGINFWLMTGKFFFSIHLTTNH